MIRRRSVCALAVFAFALVALPGCGGTNSADGGDPPQSPPTPAVAPAGAVNGELQVVATSFEFEPKSITVKAGDKATIVLQAKGLPHDITVKELDLRVRAAAGKTVKKAFSFDKPGTYTFFCSVAGHREAGMVGTLVVQ